MASNPCSSFQDCEEHCQEIYDTFQNRLRELCLALACRTRIERRQIRETYKNMYREDLVHKLQSTNSRHEICKGLALWMMEPHERDAMVAREALESGDVNYKALAEIYVGRKSSQLFLIKQAYQAKFRMQLDQDILSEPSTPYQKILVALATSHKSHDTYSSQHVAKCDAKRLYEAGEGKAGAIDESVVIEILSKRSIPQLKLTLAAYKHIYGHGYSKSLRREASGEFEDTLREVVKCVHSPSKYYSKMLYSSIKGTSADKSALTRVMVSRAEIDMQEIQEVYANKYGMQLQEALREGMPSGDYRDFVIALADLPMITK